MVTVARIVENYIKERPFIQEALAKGIINNAALASELIPEVEKALKKKVKFSAVNMAIRRLTEKLEVSFVKQAKFDITAGISMRSDLIEITVFRIENIQDSLRRIYDVIDYTKGDFLTITQGLFEVMIITNQQYEKKIVSLFEKKNVKVVSRDLSSLTIKLPEDAIDTVGFFYLITRALTWENISIIDIVSTFTETTVTVKEEDTPRAFVALKKLIEQNKSKEATS